MEKEELLELVAVLTLKNMALEEDLKAIEESYHKVVKKLHDERIEKEGDMAYDRAIGDIMNYLEDSKKYILIGNLRNYLQGLRDSK